MAEAGDVNGDGETDLLVSAPRRHNNSSNTGTAYLFFGPVDEGDINLSDADVTFDGQQRADRTGVAVAGGDLNDDGYADVVIGAPHSNNSDDDRYAGKVYVVSGGENLNETVDLGNESTVINGESWGDHAGYDLDVVNNSTAGDDLVVGAPYNNSTNTTAGAVHLIDGDEIAFDAGETQSLSDLGTKYAGEAIGDRSGWSVADAGDVNGDGRHDVIVGAYDNDSSENGAGAAYVIYGGDDRPDDATLAEADVKLSGVGTGDSTGYSVDGAGDVNGDGLADVIVGAPYNNETGTDAGAAYVVRGSELSGEVNLTDAALTLYGESESDLAGFDVSGGPCNESVYVGAPGADSATGSAYAVGGDATGEASLSGAAATYHGEAEGDGAGFSLAGATNLTDEDTEELLVGAPYHDGNANDSGAAYLLTDACPTSEEDVTDAPPEEATDDREDTEEEDNATIPVHDDPQEEDDDEEEEEEEDEEDEDEEEEEDEQDNETDDNETVDAVERVTPVDGEATVSPGTRVLFEVETSEFEGNSVDAEWNVDGEGVFVDGPQQDAYNVQGMSFLQQEFTEAGTHEVNVTVSDDDGELGTVSWTVTVEEGGGEAPSLTNKSPEDDQLPTEEDTELSVDVSDGDGDLHRVVWIMGVADTVEGMSSVNGAEDTATATVDGRCDECPMYVWIVDEDGAMTAVSPWIFSEDDDNETDTVERMTPASGEVTVAPGAEVMFEVSASEYDGNYITAEWTVDGQGSTTPMDAFHQEYGWEGEEFYQQQFTERGTHEVTVTVYDENQESVGTAEWTVTVEEGSKNAPSVTGATPDPGEIDVPRGEDAEDLSFEVSDEDGDLHRVVWFLGIDDIRAGTASVSGSQDTVTTSIENPGDSSPVIVWVVDESGTMTEETVWHFNTTDPTEDDTNDANTQTVQSSSDNTTSTDSDSSDGNQTSSADGTDSDDDSGTNTTEDDGDDSTEESDGDGSDAALSTWSPLAADH